MRVIELTRTHDNGKSESFYVNPDHIVSFVAGWGDIGSYVSLTTANFAVKEPPRQIIGRLADHRSTVRAEADDKIAVYR